MNTSRFAWSEEDCLILLYILSTESRKPLVKGGAGDLPCRGLGWPQPFLFPEGWGENAS